MGCNCATQEQISRLYKIYGDKSVENISNKQKVGFFFKKIIVFLVVFIFSPFLIGFVLYKGIFTKDKKISVRKFLRFKSDDIDNNQLKNIIEETSLMNNGK